MPLKELTTNPTFNLKPKLYEHVKDDNNSVGLAATKLF